MSYSLKSVTIRTNNEQIDKMNEIWQDIFNGKLPLLFDSKGEAINVFPISCYENYASDETGDYDLSIIGADQVYLQQLEAKVATGKYQKYEAVASSIADSAPKAWQQVWQQSHNGIIKRAFTHDYELSLIPKQTPDQRFHTILYIALS